MFLEAPNNESVEWYAEMTKKLLDRHDGKKDVIVDLGAHVGTFSIQAVADYHAKFVLAVEADLRNFDYLLGNIAGNEYEGTVFPVWGAVSSKSFNTEVLRAAKTTGQRSLIFSPMFPGKPVLTIALSDVLGMVCRRFGRIDFLKIDIEGAEWESFKDPRVWSYLKKVRYIDLELHPQEDGLYFDMLKQGQIETLKTKLSTIFDAAKSEDREFYGVNNV